MSCSLANSAWPEGALIVKSIEDFSKSQERKIDGKNLVDQTQPSY